MPGCHDSAESRRRDLIYRTRLQCTLLSTEFACYAQKDARGVRGLPKALTKAIEKEREISVHSYPLNLF